MFSNEQLTSPDFDEVAYLRYALRVPSFSTEHARLEHCIAEVKAGMEAILADHADELIDQARCTYKAQREVSSVRQSTDSLQKATGRLRLMIEEPYLQLQSRVRELEATQEAAQLLQSTLRFLSLTGRLQEQLVAAPSLDIIRASYTLREVEEVLQEDALRSLQVVDAQLPAVERYATTVRSKAHDLLAMAELTAPPKAVAAGSTSSSSGYPGGAGSGPSAASAGAATTKDVSTSRVAANVSTGLQCAYVLRMLSRTVQGFMTERRREVLRTVMRELDAQAIEEHISAECERLAHTQQASGAAGVSEQAVTAHVTLEHIQKTLFVAVQHTQCVILLWRLLLQKRDAQTQAPYLAAIDSPVQLLVEYWTTITEKVRERLSSLQKRHAIRLALASAYPRFHHLLASFLSRTDVASMAEAPMSSGGGGGGGAAAAGGTAGSGPGAALVSSIHVTQCGMGDFLDLVDVVDSAVRRVGSTDAAGGDVSASATPAKALANGVAAAGPRTDTHDLRHTWLAQVTDDVRDGFRAYVMDRHREYVGGVLARLSATLPASAAMCGQPAAVAPVRMQGSRRPPVPPQANALDLAAYTRMVTQEVQMFRQDPHTLDVLLDCAVASLRQLRSKFTEAVRRFPLPPLPAVTAAPTLVQVLHLCIANGCTTLANDFTAVLAYVPQVAPWSGSAAAASADGSGHSHGSHGDPLATALEQLSSKRGELQQLISDFHQTAERATRPFADSAQAVLLPTLTKATDNVLRAELAMAERGRGAAAAVGSGGDSRTALVQLQTQCRHFIDRFFFLIDARTSGWVEACQRMTDTLLARLLTRVVTTAPPPSLHGAVAMVAPAYGRVLQVIMPAVLQYVQVIQSAGAVGRVTSLLRGCVRQAEGFYETCGSIGRDGAAPSVLAAALGERLRPPVPAFFARLLVVQYGIFCGGAAGPDAAASASVGGGVSVAAAMELSEQAAVERVEEALLTETAAAGARSTRGAVAGVADGAAAGERLAAVEAALTRCFTTLSEAPVAASTPRMQDLWSSTTLSK